MGIRFTVITTPPAEDGLTNVWLAAPAGVRRAITRASDAIERELRDDAHLKVSPSPTPAQPALQQLTVGRLRAFVTVSEPDRQVQIQGFEWLPGSP